MNTVLMDNTSAIIKNPQGMYEIQRVYGFVDNKSAIKTLFAKTYLGEKDLLLFGSMICWCEICNTWRTQELHYRHWMNRTSPEDPQMLTPIMSINNSDFWYFQCDACKTTKCLIIDTGSLKFEFVYHKEKDPLHNPYYTIRRDLIIPKIESKVIPKNIALFLIDEQKFNLRLKRVKQK